MMFQGPNSAKSTTAVWKQYNKMAVLHFFPVNSTLIYILFSLDIKIRKFDFVAKTYFL